MYIEIQERNVNLKLTIVDTVGYGDQVNKSDRYYRCTLLFPYFFIYSPSTQGSQSHLVVTTHPIQFVGLKHVGILWQFPGHPLILIAPYQYSVLIQ